eukprot:5297813-Pleurochrysis_carterae.AAC.1
MHATSWTRHAKNTIVNMLTVDFFFSLEMAYHIRMRAPSTYKMAALRIIAYVLIEINGRKESGWFMTVFFEYDARYRRSRDKFTHGRVMKIYLAVAAEKAEEWEKARRMLYNTVFRCLAEHREMHGI